MHVLQAAVNIVSRPVEPTCTHTHTHTQSRACAHHPLLSFTSHTSMHPSHPHAHIPHPHSPAEDIQYLTKLEVLTLSNNLLRSLPKGIAALRNLKVLDLENNRLESLIPDVSYLRNLTKLNIQSNNITYLPRGVG